MTTIDTTRLRALATEVRDAYARLAIAEKRQREARRSLSSAEYATAFDSAEAAHQAVRIAKKALYRELPPDGLILALLDEVERPRASVRKLACPGCGGEVDIPLCDYCEVAGG